MKTGDIPDERTDIPGVCIKSRLDITGKDEDVPTLRRDNSLFGFRKLSELLPWQP